MKKFFLLILFSSSLFAQSELPMLIKEATNLNSTTEQCTEADFQKCATALCGDPSIHAETHQEIDPLKEYDEKKFGAIDDVEKKIRSVIEKRRVVNQGVLNTVRGNSSQLLKEWTDFEWDLYASKALLPDLDISYDEGKDILLVKPKTGIAGSDEYKKWLNESAVKIHDFFRAHPYDLYLSKVLPLNAYHKLEANKKIGGPEVGRLCQDEECRKNVTSKIQSSFDKSIDEFLKKNNDSTFINDLVTRCLSNYIQISVEQDKINQFKKLLPEVKETYLNRGMEQFSKKSRKRFKEYLDNELQFVFDHDQMRTAKQLLKDSDIIDKKDLEQQVLNDISRNRESPEFFNPFPRIPICSSFNDDKFEDAFLMAVESYSYDEEESEKRKDKITLSMSTCRFHRAGKFVVAHEIGHALSLAFSKGKLSQSSLKEYREIRGCASSASPHKGAPYLNMHPGDIETTEEDTADLFAFKAMRGEEEAAMCNLLSSNGNKYLHGEEELQLTPLEKESHSAPLVRLIRQAIYQMEKIPPVCEPVVKEYRSVYKDNKLCL